MTHAAESFNSLLQLDCSPLAWTHVACFTHSMTCTLVLLPKPQTISLKFIGAINTQGEEMNRYHQWELADRRTSLA